MIGWSSWCYCQSWCHARRRLQRWCNLAVHLQSQLWPLYVSLKVRLFRQTSNGRCSTLISLYQLLGSSMYVEKSSKFTCMLFFHLCIHIARPSIAYYCTFGYTNTYILIWNVILEEKYYSRDSEDIHWRYDINELMRLQDEFHHFCKKYAPIYTYRVTYWKQHKPHDAA